MKTLGASIDGRTGRGEVRHSYRLRWPDGWTRWTWRERSRSHRPNGTGQHAFLAIQCHPVRAARQTDGRANTRSGPASRRPAWTDGRTDGRRVWMERPERKQSRLLVPRLPFLHGIGCSTPPSGCHSIALFALFRAPSAVPSVRLWHRTGGQPGGIHPGSRGTRSAVSHGEIDSSSERVSVVRRQRRAPFSATDGRKRKKGIVSVPQTRRKGCATAVSKSIFIQSCSSIRSQGFEYDNLGSSQAGWLLGLYFLSSLKHSGRVVD